MDTTKQLAILYLIAKGTLKGDNEGNIYANGKLLAPNLLLNGYYQYGISIGFQGVIMVYGQVASYLCYHKQPYDPKLVIDHKDRNKLNNKPDNLRAISQAENLKGSWRNVPRGFMPRRRLTPDQKELIRQRHKEGISNVKIAKELNTTRQTVAKIVRL